MKKIWAHKASSFKEAEQFDAKYYLSMPATARIEAMQFLRETYLKIRGNKNSESAKGLRRVIRIIQ
ncbi:MAG: hypothetical protein JW946_01620 [Candidatus Omnitrophica bacterium]|nr:hypothetical protein [Candidatus Omnitrophota bacterium]